MANTNKKDKEKRQRRYADAKTAAAKSKGGFEWTNLSLPEGMTMFKFKRAGVYRINVIPFVTKDGNPNADVDMDYYERTYYVHNQIGPEEKTYCCPLKNWGDPCCVCDHRVKLQNKGADDETIAPFKPKKRQLWLFDDVSEVREGAHKPNFQLFEAAYFGGRGYKGFGEMINGKIEIADDGDPATRFYRLDEEGMTLKVSTQESNFKGNTYYRADEIDFAPRKVVYSESDFENVPCLDEIPKRISSSELRKIFLQEDDNSSKADASGKEKEAKAPAKKEEAASDNKVTSIVSGDDDDSTAEDLGIEKGCNVKHRKLGECVVLSIAGDGTKLKLKDKKGEAHLGVPVSECAVMDDDTPTGPKSTLPEEEDEEDEDLNDDEDMDLDDDDDEDDEDEEQEVEEFDSAKTPARKK